MVKIIGTREDWVQEMADLAGRIWDSGHATGRRSVVEGLLASVEKDNVPKTSGRALVTETPQKRGARNRAAHGAIKAAVREAIYAYPEEGVSRPGIVSYAAQRLGVTIKPGSLKQAIRILKAEGVITNANHMWFPAQTTGRGKPGAGAPDLLNRRN